MRTGEEAVAFVLDALNEMGIDYMVVGSFSSNRYGVPRATKDADLVLRMLTEDLDRLLCRLPPDFQPDPQMRFETVTGTWQRLISIPRIPFLIELFELGNDPHDRARFARRRLLTLLGRSAWLPTPEDVVIQKLRWCRSARRSKDFDDAVSILAVQGRSALDWAYLEKWCAEHGTSDALAEAAKEASPAQQ